MEGQEGQGPASAASGRLERERGTARLGAACEYFSASARARVCVVRRWGRALTRACLRVHVAVRARGCWPSPWARARSVNEQPSILFHVGLEAPVTDQGSAACGQNVHGFNSERVSLVWETWCPGQKPLSLHTHLGLGARDPSSGVHVFREFE